MARSATDEISSQFARELQEHGRLARSAPDDNRPHVVVNMVATVDGRTTVGGRVGDLTAPADQQLLRYLRAQADAVLVGGNTVRQEGYGTLRADPALGEAPSGPKAPQPWLCIVSERLALSPDLPALQNPEMRVLLVTSSDRQLPETAARVEYLRQTGPGPVSMRWALGALRQEREIQTIVCEGGPTINARLFGEGCVDDLFLAVSPRVLGDEAALTLLAGSLPASVGLSLRSHVAEGDFVFLRYQVTSY